MQAALRAEKLLTVAAGDNVVRLLPPLIIGEAEIDEAIERARPGAACGLPPPPQAGAAA